MRPSLHSSRPISLAFLTSSATRAMLLIAEPVSNKKGREIQCIVSVKWTFSGSVHLNIYLLRTRYIRALASLFFYGAYCHLFPCLLSVDWWGEKLNDKEVRKLGSQLFLVKMEQVLTSPENGNSWWWWGGWGSCTLLPRVLVHTVRIEINMKWSISMENFILMFDVWGWM